MRTALKAEIVSSKSIDFARLMRSGRRIRRGKGKRVTRG
jgi:hypothetical protein